jgi:alkylhydroperoxidase family enzyme
MVVSGLATATQAAVGNRYHPAQSAPRSGSDCDPAAGGCSRFGAGSPGEEDLAWARDAGFTEDEIWDVGSITALFAASNRLAHLAALRPGG